MLLQLISSLTTALQDNFFISMAAAFIWGILSILLSPCHLSSIPLIVGFISGQKDLTLKKATRLSFLFSIGILITIAFIGLITSLSGRMMGDIGKWGNVFVAIIFFIIGLYLLDVIKFSFLNRISQPQFQKKGFWAAFILGLIFGVALGPCTFAFMAPVLAVVFAISSTQLLKGILLILFYALGHCSVIILAGTFTKVVQKYLLWNERSKGILILKKICGGLVILGGIYLIYTM